LSVVQPDDGDPGLQKLGRHRKVGFFARAEGSAMDHHQDRGGRGAFRDGHVEDLARVVAVGNVGRGHPLPLPQGEASGGGGHPADDKRSADQSGHLSLLERVAFKPNHILRP
jgi:hypothetical protein